MFLLLFMEPILTSTQNLVVRWVNFGTKSNCIIQILVYNRFERLEKDILENHTNGSSGMSLVHINRYKLQSLCVLHVKRYEISIHPFFFVAFQPWHQLSSSPLCWIFFSRRKSKRHWSAMWAFLLFISCPATSARVISTSRISPSICSKSLWWQSHGNWTPAAWMLKWCNMTCGCACPCGQVSVEQDLAFLCDSLWRQICVLHHSMTKTVYEVDEPRECHLSMK